MAHRRPRPDRGCRFGIRHGGNAYSDNRGALAHLAERSRDGRQRAGEPLQRAPAHRKRLPEGTGYHPGGTKSLQKDCADINCYREYVKANNALADVILDLAVHNRDEALLEVAVSHYLDEPEIVEDGYDQKVVYRRSDKLAKFVDFARSKGLDQVPGLMEAEDYGVELPEVEMPEVELPDVELPEQ